MRMAGKSGVILLFVLIFALMPVQAYALTIVVDPGHGGKDPGAIGVNGLYEKDVNRQVAEKLKAELEAMGFSVLMTSEEDRTMTLQERVDFKEMNGADLFVSIHANSHHDSTVQGSLVLYYDQRYPMEEYPASPEMAVLTSYSKELATLVLDHMSAKAGTENLGIMPSSVYVVRNGTMPSILVETAFLSNPEEAERLTDDAFLDSLAQGIAEGIAQFQPDGFADVEGHWAEGAILRMREAGIVQGQHRYRYEPEKPLTRVEFLTMADRLFQFSQWDKPSVEGESDNDTVTVTEDVYAQNDISSEDISPVDDQPITSDDEANEVNDEDQPVIFPDMDESHWGFEIMQTASQLGIIQGYPDGSVKPDAPISRAEVATLFYRLMQEDNTPVTVANEVESDNEFALFEDVPQTEWYANAVYQLVEAQLLQGIGEGFFEPGRNMNRAEAAVLFDRAVD